jgi:hypothetical protein
MDENPSESVQQIFRTTSLFALSDDAAVGFYCGSFECYNLKVMFI